MWIPLKGAAELIKKLGGGKEGFQKALKQKPQLFENTGPRKTKKLDPKTSRTTSKGASTKGKSSWNSVPAKIRKQLESGNTKGFTEEQLAKYRTLYKNRN